MQRNMPLLLKIAILDALCVQCPSDQQSRASAVKLCVALAPRGDHFAVRNEKEKDKGCLPRHACAFLTRCTSVCQVAAARGHSRAVAMNALSPGFSPDALPGWTPPSGAASGTESSSISTTETDTQTQTSGGEHRESTSLRAPAPALLPGSATFEGAPPWMREGGGHAPPGEGAAAAAAERWQTRTTEMQSADAARREERRRRTREEAEAEANKRLEEHARRMFYVGFAALPFVWLMSVAYFWKELKSPDSNPNIKKRTWRFGALHS
jgi:hypothetical protein